MAVIHYYDGIKNNTTFAFNGKLRNFSKLIDWDNSVLLMGGQRVTPDYEARPDDIIYIRKIPSAATTAAIIVGVTAILAGGVALGITLYNNKKAAEQMEEAQKASKAAAESVNKLPYIKGTRNQAATGQSFPFALGKSLMTPYLLCPPRYTIKGTDGVDQYYNAVLEVGFNDILINKIKMGETVIKDFTGVTIPQNGVYSFDSGLYYDERNKIEIRQTGAFLDPDFNEKIILTELNKEIPHRRASGDDPDEYQEIEEEWKAGVVQELPTNAQAVELIALFDGLRAYNDGSWGPATIKLLPQWTNVNNPEESDWVDFDNGFNQNGTYSNTFTRTTRNQLRFCARQEFTAAQAYGKTIKVRIRRTTPKADGSANDTVYLMAVQTTCYDAKKSSAEQLVTADVLEPDKRDKCCRIGVRIIANKNTEGLFDAISVIETGTARTWDGTEWSETKTPTENLAAWALELLTSPHHKASQYQDSELDLATFGAWYEYCETEGFKANGVITNGAKKQTVLDTLCKNSNAALVYNRLTGLIEVAIDNGRDYPVALLNSENIISISTSKELKRKVDGRRVSYINAAGDYDVDTVTFMKDGGEYDPETDTLTETTLQYVTDYNHAFKIAWRQMAEEAAQPRVITIQAGLESAYYPLYSRVLVQHRSLKNGLAHATIKGLEWNNSYLQKIKLTSRVTFPEGENCGVLINCVSDTGHGVVALEVSGSGTTDELQVETTLRSNAPLIPEIGNLLSFGTLDENGEFKTITADMKITNAEETDKGYNLTLVDYNPAVYQYGTLPTYKSNLTTRPNGTVQTVEGQREYITAGDAEANASAAAQAAVDIVSGGYNFTNIYRLRPPSESLEEIIKKIDEDASNSAASISISEEEILLQVENTAKGLRGLIDIQAGSVSAMVEGGGSSGQMSLSLNLPVMITAEKRAQLIAASTESKVNAVYGYNTETGYYSIKPDATAAAVKALWADAVDGGLLASQIELQADQIYIEGDVIVNDENKIKAALLEVENILATDISVKDKGVIHSDNYSGTIDENGNITEYGDEGWAIDHAGKADFVNLNATGGTFHNGFFSGLLDCGIFKIARDIIRYTILKYETSQKDEFFHYLLDTYGYNYNYDGNISGLYGENAYFNLDGVLYAKINIKILEGRATDTGIIVYNESVQTDGVLIYERFGSAVIITDELYYPFWIEYVQNNALIMNIDGLPTYDPHVAGRAWNSGGTLRISAG